MEFEFKLGTPTKIVGPCGKEVTVNVLWGSAQCSKCKDNICYFDYIKTKNKNNVI